MTHDSSDFALTHFIGGPVGPRIPKPECQPRCQTGARVVDYLATMLLQASVHYWSMFFSTIPECSCSPGSCEGINSIKPGWSSDFKPVSTTPHDSWNTLGSRRQTSSAPVRILLLCAGPDNANLTSSQSGKRMAKLSMWLTDILCRGDQGLTIPTGCTEIQPGYDCAVRLRRITAVNPASTDGRRTSQRFGQITQTSCLRPPGGEQSPRGYYSSSSSSRYVVQR